MKAIAQELLRFTRTYSHRGFLICMSILLIGLIVFNFTYDFEDSVIDSYTGSWLKGLWMFLYEGIPYLITAVLLTVFGLQKDWFKKPGFWLRFFIGFGILAFDRSWYIWYDIQPLVKPQEAVFVFKNATSAKSLISVVLPMIVVYWLIEDRHKREFYGLNFSGFKPKPYFAILGIALVFIFIGGFFGDLQNYYPRYLKSQGDTYAAFHGISEGWSVFIYEFFYGLDFISTELVFRGFLIMAMYRYLGPYVVYPMVVSYCILHFGKPLTEAVSSIFGGYILGIIALYHRNIWGGIIIHVGVAWGMEIIGYLHRIV